jgi:hypothetical protein
MSRSRQAPLSQRLYFNIASLTSIATIAFQDWLAIGTAHMSATVGWQADGVCRHIV